jgi:hypothetical protein
VEANIVCRDCAWLLRALVGDHDAGLGLSHPGVERLCLRCHATDGWVVNHLRHLVEGGHIVLVKRWPRPMRRADDYAIPWLDNKPVTLADGSRRREKAKRSAPRNQGAQRVRVGVRSRTPPLLGKRRDVAVADAALEGSGVGSEVDPGAGSEPYVKGEHAAGRAEPAG